MPQKQIRIFPFTTTFNARARVLITPARVFPAFDPSKTSKHPSGFEVQAIWDTGATHTVITASLAKKCGLKPISIAEVYNAGDKKPKRAHVYMINLHLPSNVGFSSLRVTEGILRGEPEMLIGMDIISQGDFAVTNKDGKTVMSFRIPSIQRIDFVKNEPPTPGVVSNKKLTAGPKVGRNAPCPCGSGKKYKNCCGK